MCLTIRNVIIPPHPNLGPDLVQHLCSAEVVNPLTKVSESDEKRFLNPTKIISESDEKNFESNEKVSESNEKKFLNPTKRVSESAQKVSEDKVSESNEKVSESNEKVSESNEGVSESNEKVSESKFLNPGKFLNPTLFYATLLFFMHTNMLDATHLVQIYVPVSFLSNTRFGAKNLLKKKWFHKTMQTPTKIVVMLPRHAKSVKNENNGRFQA